MTYIQQILSDGKLLACIMGKDKCMAVSSLGFDFSNHFSFKIWRQMTSFGMAMAVSHVLS